MKSEDMEFSAEELSIAMYLTMLVGGVVLVLADASWWILGPFVVVTAVLGAILEDKSKADDGESTS